MLPVLLVTTGIGLGYLAVLILFMPDDGLWAGDQGTKWLQAETLVRNGFANAAIPYPGAAIDPQGRFSPLWVFCWPHDGRYYGLYPYPQALATAAFIRVVGDLGHYGLPLIGVLGTMILSGIAARRWSPRWAWLVPAALGSATPLAFYALVPWEHALAVCLTTMAVVSALWHLEGRGQYWALIGGLSAGGAIWMRDETVWFALALPLAVVVYTRDLRSFLPMYAIGLSSVLAVFVVTNDLMYGAPLGPLFAFHQAASKTAGALLSEGPTIALSLLFEMGDGAAWPLAMTAVAAVGVLLVRRHRPWVLLAPAGMALWALWTSQPLDLRIGLVSTSPLLLLAFLAIPFRKQVGLLGALSGIIIPVFFAGIVGTALPDCGGAQWGPRFLLPLIPLLGLLAFGGTIGLLRTRSRFTQTTVVIAVAVLLTASVWIQFRGVRILLGSTTHIAHINSTVNSTVASLDTDVVVTDTWFEPQILGPVFLDHKVLFVNAPQQLGELSNLLTQNGVDAFAYLSGRQIIRDGLLSLPPSTRCQETQNLPLDLVLIECTAASTNGTGRTSGVPTHD